MTRIANFTEATHVIEALIDRVDQLERETAEFAHATIIRVEAAATQADLEELAERTAMGLGRLSVAIIRLQRSSRWARFVAWLGQFQGASGPYE